jgi:hypothetical protein
MTAINNHSLCITITDTEPEQRRMQLIKAIAASMRWQAHCSNSELYFADKEHTIILSDLLAELASLEAE